MSPRIVHFGVGNFHRAHQAWYTQRANEVSGESWKITGVSLRRPDTRDALALQDYRYTLETRQGDESAYEILSVHDRLLVASEELDAVLETVADPATAIITLTVTEKGYHLRLSDRRLDRQDPEVTADLAGGPPRTTLGVLAAGLAQRRAGGGAPLTILSCDNLPANGSLLRAALLGFVAADPELAGWIEEAVSFPATMVDRIVPATTEELRQRVRHATGWDDAWPVSTEPFSEWVIEDRFAGPRPRWEEVGVQLVADVEPYELRKLRLLNGAHSTLTYAGLCRGVTYSYEAVDDPELLAEARAVMAEAAATLPASISDTAAEYGQSVIERVANRAIKHALRQIAADGSEKVSVRLVAPLCERAAKGLASPAMERAIASWLAFVCVEVAAGRALDDPMNEVFQTLCSGGLSAGPRPLLTLETLAPLWALDPSAPERIGDLAERLLLDAAEVAPRSPRR